jgi:sugar phosphate isomerase/epimerase
MNPTAIRALKKIGYDYVETHAWEAIDADDAKKAAYLDVLAETGLKCEVSAYAFPGVYNPAGEQTKEELKAARELFYEKIKKSLFLGYEILVIGSGGVRNYPTDKGYDIKNVYEQLAQVCAEVISPVCKEFGLTAAIEGLQQRESPTFNLTEQSVATAKASGKDNIKVMADYFHMFVEKEDLSKFGGFGDYLVHTHIANPEGRIMPAEGDGANYREFFDALKAAGFNARLSCEARVQGEYEPTLAAAYHEMKKYLW